MKRALLCVTVCLTTLAVSGAQIERAAKQAELDARCETARQQKIAPERAAAIEECVANEEKEDRAACERFYRDYGERSGRKGPMYYWLPACEEAHAFRQGEERASS